MKDQLLHPLVHVVMVVLTKPTRNCVYQEALTLTSNGFPLLEFLDALRIGIHSIAQHPLRAIFDSHDIY